MRGTLRAVEATAPIEHLERPPKRLWNQLLAEPDRAPELIALAAAERFAPQAEEWVRIAGPGHTPQELARVAFKKHVRLARLEGGALGIGGAITAAPDLVALLWIQSRMVFYIAAAYGYDPKHPMRPAEYLALQGLYDTPAEAREALDGVGKRMAQAMVERALSKRDTEVLHLKLAKYIAKRLARRYAGRLIPFVGAPLGAIQNGGVTKQLGRRALDYYARP
ncbi:MAG TPA: EcsC family protein [Thermoleophilaceae bacterium]|nr:EcsC family protein [Thermoleophilaceae bacterium]